MSGCYLPQILRNSSSCELLDGLANCERIRLRKEVGHELIMVRDDLRIVINWRLRFCEANELSCDRAALVHQLVEAMLSISAWLSKDYWSSVDISIETSSIFSARLAVALHIELLDVSWESQQGLAVRQDCTRLNSTDVSVVEANEAEHGHSAFGQVS